jgi:AraC family transcriptional activator of mtrCDE
MNNHALSLEPPGDADHLVHWLVESMQLEATVFHLGQYCGRWHASTAGQALGSFHLILHGSCYLHIAGQPPVRLDARDAVFMMRDVPHFLSPGIDGVPPGAPSMPMQPLAAPDAGATGLACGFFHFRDALSTLIVDAFPDYLVLRAGDPSVQALGMLFDLILLEPPRAPDAPSPLVARLAELMFFYVVRHLARRHDIAAGVLAVARLPAFAGLLGRLLDAPGQHWSTGRMADAVHMSRSSFYKHFSAVAGQAPAQFLLLLRMKIAAQRLGGGESVERTATHVGYASYAAFSRAFKKVQGVQPGAYRRRHVAPLDDRAEHADERRALRPAVPLEFPVRPL